MAYLLGECSLARHELNPAQGVMTLVEKREIFVGVGKISAILGEKIFLVYVRDSGESLIYFSQSLSFRALQQRN